MKNPVYRTSSGDRMALSNLWYGNESSIAEIEDAVADSKTGSELCARLNKLKLFNKFVLDGENSSMARLKQVDCWGNVRYFQAEKEKEQKHITQGNKMVICPYCKTAQSDYNIPKRLYSNKEWVWHDCEHCGKGFGYMQFVERIYITAGVKEETK